MADVTRRRTTSHVRRSAVAAAVFALAILSSLGASGAASAAETELGEADIIGWEDGAEGTAGYNYDQWHIGSAEVPGTPVTDSLDFGPCSVTLHDGITADWTQVLKGYPVDERPTGDENGIEELYNLIQSISLDVEAGRATVQIPIKIYYSTGGGTEWFTTLRNVTPLGPGHFQMDSSTVLRGSTSGFDEWSLDGWMTYFEDSFAVTDSSWIRVEILGVGFNGDVGTEISMLGFGGNTYRFGSGCGLAPTPPSEIQTAVQ